MLDSTCQWLDCHRPTFSRGLCKRDHMRARRAGMLDQFSSPDVICRRCETVYPEGTKSGKWFCSEVCRHAAQLERKAIRRVALLGERTCEFCQGPVPLEFRSDAHHCSVICQQSSWYVANDERLRKTARKWAVNNQDKRLVYGERRRARIMKVPTEAIDFQEVWLRDEGRCWICDKAVDTALAFPHPLSRSLDHVVPLSKNGSHLLTNVAIAHLRCNLSKKDRLLEHLPRWFDDAV